jgi:hypothetical protein
VHGFAKVQQSVRTIISYAGSGPAFQHPTDPQSNLFTKAHFFIKLRVATPLFSGAFYSKSSQIDIRGLQPGCGVARFPE